ncbi:unnamed protein product [Adineta ricciae]|nr:unnamed protein product [Adineta ricciae]
MQNRKILGIILLVIVAAIVTVGILLPTTILKKNKHQPSTPRNSKVTFSTSSASTLTSTTTKEPDPIPTDAVQGIVYGVYNTSVGDDSKAATPGKGIGQYITHESPGKACDGNVSTKYVSFGPCSEGTSYDDDHGCGLRTGFFLKLETGSTLVNGLRVCTANDLLERDPIIVSLEGSNSTGTNLTLGASWTLLYDGPSGLLLDPGRRKCGPIQYFDNIVEYSSYRFLVSGKRRKADCIQYSEVKLYSV